MKKFVALLFTLLQLFYIVSISYPLDTVGEDIATGVSVQEVRGCSSLLTVVCDNTINSLLKLAELANLVSTAQPSPQKEDPFKNTNKTTDSIGLLSCSKVLADHKSMLETFHSKFHSGGKKLTTGLGSLSVFLLFILIASICLYLYRLKLRYLKPRGSIDDSIFSMPYKGIKNPNLDTNRIRVFLLLTRIRNNASCMTARLKHKTPSCKESILSSAINRSYKLIANNLYLILKLINPTEGEHD